MRMEQNLQKGYTKTQWPQRVPSKEIIATLKRSQVLQGFRTFFSLLFSLSLNFMNNLKM